MTLTGRFVIAGDWIATADTFRAVDPATDAEIGPPFSIAGSDHVAAACIAAYACFREFSTAPLEARAGLLDTIADEIAALGEPLIARGMAETGLAHARLSGERDRTVNQLRLFANLVRSETWQDRRFDPALPDRTPLPRPDIRAMKRPIGPVAVFGASNFPLAFSVAGGDTASALAAGCPVIVKGHPAHPGLSEMVAGAIVRALASTGLPAGAFSMLSGTGHHLGAALAADPRIAAVAFTGSRGGGLALARIAAARPAPIPVFAEMSSVNPVLLLPHALAARGEQIAKDFVASLTFSGGQLCTNPGVVIALDSPELEAFLASAADQLAKAQGAVMLSAGICSAYDAGVAALRDHPQVRSEAAGLASANQASAALFSISAADFAADPSVRHEVFGAAALIVRCGAVEEIERALDAMEGQLTATLQMDDKDVPLARHLMPRLERKAGRLIANGWPTGVEVVEAMVHGGPFPATSDGRSSSVGTLAIERFLRPVCFQNMPQALLPDALKDAG